MINVCFGLNDKTGHYSKFTGTTICSILENYNAPPHSLTIHILHDDTLTANNRDKFIYLAGRYSQDVKFYNVEKICPEKIKEIVELVPWIKDSRLTIGAMYRLLITKILPANIEKIIYLDSDVIVNLDMKELWNIDIEDKILAAVSETLNNGKVTADYSLVKNGIVKLGNYFNSGVLLINLKIWRNEENTLKKALKFWGENPKYQDYRDQNILNYCFSTRYFKLPLKFNRFVLCARWQEEKPERENIYHYVGNGLGLGASLDMSDSFNQLWLSYFAKTPWFNEKIFDGLECIIRKMHDALKKSALNLSASIAGKSRAFLIFETELDNLLKNFSVSKDEEIIIVKDGSPFQKIINLMNGARGQKFFFILLPGCSLEPLNEAGFVQGRDFLDCSNFFEFNSYPFLQSM